MDRAVKGSPVKLRRAAACIIHGLVWETSPQGHSYWKLVYDNLRNLAADVDPAPFNILGWDLL